jgi:hypothetical protein
MLRRLFACLALITGLTAFGVPVDARVLPSAEQQLASSAGTSQPGKGVNCDSQAQQRPGHKAKDVVRSDCRQRAPVVIFIPTVQFGADRAFE